MSALRAELRSLCESGAAPEDVSVQLTLTNTGEDAVAIDRSQLLRAPLVLEVQDQKEASVSLPPPSVPGSEAEASEKGEELPAGESLTVIYTNFTDSDLASGRYRVRFRSDCGATGGGPEAPLCSEYLDLEVANPRPARKVAPLAPVGAALEKTGLALWWYRWWHWWKCFWFRLLRVFGLVRCRTVSREVDEPTQEVITDAPPPNQAWNGTYSWNARFQVVVDRTACTATIVVRLRVTGTITAAQQAAWAAAIEAAWSGLFKLCCPCDCCCEDGYTLNLDVQFVTTGEHHVVNAGATTTNMTNWGAADTTDISHEMGHMLGNPEEYYTVNGTPFGAPRQPGGNVMNNPANPPVAAHYDLVRTAVQDALGRTCRTVTVATNC